MKHAVCAKGERVASAPNVMADRTCAPCLAMHFSNATNAASCERCPDGKFQDKPGHPFCETCSEGFVCRASEVTGLVELQQCPPGMQCNGVSVVPCVNQISNPATGQCVSCKDGEFADLEDNLCVPCPPGFRCSGFPEIWDGTQPGTQGRRGTRGRRAVLRGRFSRG